jgi:hypothetical protein
MRSGLSGLSKLRSWAWIGVIQDHNLAAKSAHITVWYAGTDHNFIRVPGFQLRMCGAVQWEI